MKKIIFLCFCLVCVFHGAYGIEECLPITDCTVGARKNLTGAGEILDIGNGKCLICDANVGNEECSYNTIVIFPDGRIKKCLDDNGAIDVWHDYSPTKKCTDSDLNNFKKSAGKYAFSTFADYENGVYKVDDICIMPEEGKTQEQKDCEAAIARGEPANWNNNKCDCGSKVWDENQQRCVDQNAVKCIDSGGLWKKDDTCDCGDKIWDEIQQRCVDQNAAESEEKPADDSIADKSSFQRCLEGRNTQNGKACCYLSNNTAAYDANNDKCICKNGGAEATITNGRAVCSGLSNKEKEKETVIMPPVKGDDPLAQQRAESLTNIQSAHKAVKTIADQFKKSHWKNEDGEFNTSRLASDSIAGVVLGTAGGLITSNVVKKNQVKNGFEDIECVIGGQTVAGWGDEFNVAGN